MQTGSNQRSRSPHIRSYNGDLIDYNGVGMWAVEAIQKRYMKYAEDLGAAPAQIVPVRHTEGGRTWVFPVMQQIIALIEAGDLAAVEIGIEFICEDDFFAFGKVLKLNTGRALRRATLTPDQESRIRERLVGMLLSGQVPYEWHEYKRLLRRIGLGSLWAILEKDIDRQNKHVMRYYDYLDRYAR